MPSRPRPFPAIGRWKFPAGPRAAPAWCGRLKSASRVDMAGASDTLKLIGAGEDLGLFLADHFRLNAWTKAARANKFRDHFGALTGAADDDAQLAVWVRNDSGIKVPQFGVLTLKQILNSDP